MNIDMAGPDLGTPQRRNVALAGFSAVAGAALVGAAAGGATDGLLPPQLTTIALALVVALTATSGYARAAFGFAAMASIVEALRFAADPSVGAGVTAASIAGLYFLLAWVITSLLSPSAPAPEPAQPLDDAQRRASLAANLARCSGAFLASGDEPAQRAALDELRDLIGADVIGIIRNDRSSGVPIGRIDLWESGAERLHLPEQVDWTERPIATGRLSVGRTVTHDSLSAIPPIERDAVGGASLVLGSRIDVPIMEDGMWTGTLFAGSFDEGRDWTDGSGTILQGVADVVAAAWLRRSGLEHLNRILEQRDIALRLQAALTETARIMLDASEPSALDDALDVMRSALGCAVVAVADLVDASEEPVLRLVASAQRSGDVPVLPPESSWTGRPDSLADLLAGRPAVIDDVENLTDREHTWFVAHRPWSKAEIVFPIHDGDQLIGAVFAVSTSPRAWGAGEIRTLSFAARVFAAHRHRTAARRVLEDLIVAKDRFIASVSHELRTPMSVVFGLASELNLRREEFSEEDVDEFIELIHRQSRSVTHIIEDLLVAARASETDITIIPEAASMADIVDTVLTELPTEQTSKIAEVRVGDHHAWVDPLRMRQVVRNLVVNAHRHGGSNVWVAARATEDQIVLSVSDDGVGVPEERRESIFEAYTSRTVDHNTTAAIGLGLTVSRQLARLMGGDVRYRLDHLSTFEVLVPRAARSQVSTAPRLRAVRSIPSRDHRSA